MNFECDHDHSGLAPKSALLPRHCRSTNHNNRIKGETTLDKFTVQLTHSHSTPRYSIDYTPSLVSIYLMEFRRNLFPSELCTFQNPWKQRSNSLHLHPFRILSTLLPVTSRLKSTCVTLDGALLRATRPYHVKLSQSRHPRPLRDRAQLLLRALQAEL